MAEHKNTFSMAKITKRDIGIIPAVAFANNFSQQESIQKTLFNSIGDPARKAMAAFERTREKSHTSSHMTANEKKRLATAMANPLTLLMIHGAEGQNRTADTEIFRPNF